VTGGVPPTAYGQNNYVGCIGDRATLATRARDSNGIFFNAQYRNSEGHTDERVRIASIKDGTSNVVAISECIIGFPHLNVNASGWQWPGNNGCPLSGSPETNNRRQRGSMYYDGYFPAMFLFTTLMTPNSRLWDCGSNSGNTMFTARSFHPGGVQAGLADGSTHFVSETIEWATWRWLGNKADGRVVQVP
jgi:hypothetical protein